MVTDLETIRAIFDRAGQGYDEIVKMADSQGPPWTPIPYTVLSCRRPDDEWVELVFNFDGSFGHIGDVSP